MVNRPGAGGTAGTAALANSAPDGYTLLMALASISTNPEQDRLSGRQSAFQLAPAMKDMQFKTVMRRRRPRSPASTRPN